MKHKIILTPSIDGTDFLKSLSALGTSPSETFNVRYMSTLELAKYLLECNGITLPSSFLSDLVLASQLYQDVKEIDYFRNYSFSDVYSLIKSLNKLRECIPYNEKEEIRKLLDVPSFKRKNEAIIEFYELYTKTLKDNNNIDEIGIVRYAIEHCKGISNAEIIRYEEFDYSNLSLALLDTASDKQVKVEKLFDNQKPHISRYTKAYGQNSEIEDILAYIYENNIKFDECVIAASDTSTYEKILSNYQGTLKFPLVVNNGQSIKDTSCGRLFGYILSWMESHFHLNYLLELLNSREFDLDKFKTDIGYSEEKASEVNFELALSGYDVFNFDLIVTTVGNLRIGIDDNKNNNISLSNYSRLVNNHLSEDPDNNIYKRDKVVFEYVDKVAEVFSRSILQILNSYLVIDENNLPIETNALDKYSLVLSLCAVNYIPLKEAIKFLDDVVVGFRKPMPGALFLTSITNSISYLRKHLFIVGLDSKSFPGKVSEDPIVLDQDYSLFGVKDASSKSINENKKLYHDLIGLASSLGVNIHLSYAYYNSETAKEQNASSVVFETYKKEYGDSKTVNDLNMEFDSKNNCKFRIIGAFEHDLFPLSILGRKAKESVIVTPIEVDKSTLENVDASSLISRRGLSATQIEKYVNCEYEFFLSALLKLDEEKKINIYEIISPTDLGNLAHELMERFSLTDTEEEFLNKAKKAFIEYLIAHPCGNLELANIALFDFTLMMKNGYEMESYEHTPSVLNEEEIFAIHEPSGIKLHGYPDKVVRLSDGSYRVIDYKTGNTVRHDVDKKESLLQGALYSYILEHGKNKLNSYGYKKINVSEFVFRYLRNRNNISSSDKDHNIKEYTEYLDEVLLRIKESLKTGKFEKNGDCKSCYFKNICGGKKE